MFLRVLMLVVALAFSGSASAKRFCYYWVDDTGNTDTFETPPLDMGAPPFASTRGLNGHLVVGITEKSCRNSALQSNPTQVASSTPERDPITAPGVNISSGIAPIDDGTIESTIIQPVQTADPVIQVPRPVQ